MNDVFISYSRKDDQIAGRIEALVKAEGWTVFRDHRISPGSEWHNVVLQEAEQDSCMVVLWSKDSISSAHVLEEAAIGLRRGVLLPVFLDSATPPSPFPAIQAANSLPRGDHIADLPAISNLIWAIAMKCGSKQSLTIWPLDIFIVVGRRKFWPILGPTINMNCRFENLLERTVTVRLIAATVHGPYPHPLHFSLNAPYDVFGSEQLARVDENNLIELTPGELACGVQLEAARDKKRNVWLAGTYSFDIRGWTDHMPSEPPNFRTRADISVSDDVAGKVSSLFDADDATWEALKASDNAKAVRVDIREVKVGLPTIDDPARQ